MAEGDSLQRRESSTQSPASRSLSWLLQADSWCSPPTSGDEDRNPRQSTCAAHGDEPSSERHSVPPGHWRIGENPRNRHKVQACAPCD